MAEKKLTSAQEKQVEQGALQGEIDAGRLDLSRVFCMDGSYAKKFADDQAKYEAGTPGYGPQPDLGKHCLAIINQTIHDHTEAAPYADILEDKKMIDAKMVKERPQDVSKLMTQYVVMANQQATNAANKDSTAPAVVTLSSGEKTYITPGVALDSAYILNYFSKGKFAASREYSVPEIKEATTACFQQEETLGICHDMGIIHSQVALGLRAPMSVFDVANSALPLTPTKINLPAGTKLEVDKKEAVGSIQP